MPEKKAGKEKDLEKYDDLDNRHDKYQSDLDKGPDAFYRRGEEISADMSEEARVSLEIRENKQNAAQLTKQLQELEVERQRKESELLKLREEYMERENRKPPDYAESTAGRAEIDHAYSVVYTWARNQTDQSLYDEHWRTWHNPSLTPIQRQGALTAISDRLNRREFKLPTNRPKAESRRQAQSEGHAFPPAVQDAAEYKDYYVKLRRFAVALTPKHLRENFNHVHSQVCATSDPGLPELLQLKAYLLDLLARLRFAQDYAESH